MNTCIAMQPDIRLWRDTRDAQTVRVVVDSGRGSDARPEQRAHDAANRLDSSGLPPWVRKLFRVETAAP